MAAPVTPAESVGQALDREIEKGEYFDFPQEFEHHGSDAATVKYETKEEDQDVNMEGSPPGPGDSDDDRQLKALEDALRAAGTEDFKSAFFAFGKALLVKYNGAYQVLSKLIDCPPDFVKSLHDNFPKSDAVRYATQLPANDTDEFNLHLSDLSWLPESSTKPAPYLHTCLLLWDEITTNGFVTKGALINQVCRIVFFPALISMSLLSSFGSLFAYQSVLV